MSLRQALVADGDLAGHAVSAPATLRVEKAQAITFLLYSFLGLVLADKRSLIDHFLSTCGTLSRPQILHAILANQHCTASTAPDLPFDDILTDAAFPEFQRICRRFVIDVGLHLLPFLLK